MLTKEIMDQWLQRKRRLAISQHATVIGIDFIKFVTEPRPHLQLHFIPKTNVSSLPDRNSIAPENIQITDAEDRTSQPFAVQRIIFPGSTNYPALPANALAIEIIENNANSEHDATRYTLKLIKVPNLDPFFDQIDFFRRENVATIAPCDSDTVALTDIMPAPEINYLAKDYLSFVKLMSDRLAALIPDWPAGSAADLGNVIIEILAYAADQLSYFQDAVATEAYLSTARRRISVKRHSRLLDYTIHEGCNARVWVHIKIDDEHLSLPVSTPLLSRITDNQVQIDTNSVVYQTAPKQSLLTFSTMTAIELYKQHNEIYFYNWGSPEFFLPAGTVTATLIGHFDNLKPGDVLVFEETLNSMAEQTPDINHRHVVRLLTVSPDEDLLKEQFDSTADNTSNAITHISWYPEDALPFDLVIAKLGPNNQTINNFSVARANMVLADHGQIIAGETLSPTTVPEQGVYYPHFQHTDLTFRVSYDDDSAKNQGANAVLKQDPHAAQPIVSLTSQDNVQWNTKPDLLSSRAADRDFVIEMEEDRQAFIRFGDDIYGKKPTAGTLFVATYQSGNGTAGNIGAEALAHIIYDEGTITEVRNPLPAYGGTDPESIAQVKLLAPQAFLQQQRCVTLEDYIKITEQYTDVKRAAALRRWTGSWYTVFIAVERQNDKPLTETFKQQLTAYLNDFNLLGHEIKIVAPKQVPLNIAIVVQVKSGYLAEKVKQDLLERFNVHQSAVNQNSFFNPDNFNFGESIYLSQIITDVLAVPGVYTVNLQSPLARFQRWDTPSALDKVTPDERIYIAPLEMAQIRNNPNAPEQGQILFYVENS